MTAPPLGEGQKSLAGGVQNGRQVNRVLPAASTRRSHLAPPIITRKPVLPSAHCPFFSCRFQTTSVTYK